MDLSVAWPWLLGGLIVFMALLALWWWFPQWQLRKLWTRWPSSAPTDLKVLADVEDNFRKTVGQLLGGAAVLAGAAFAYLQFQQQQTSAHNLLISNQVAKGFELLGNKEGQIQQRLGGIYALEGVMNTSKEYYQPALEALSAFVREHEKAKKPAGVDLHATPFLATPPVTDVQAAPHCDRAA